MIIWWSSCTDKQPALRTGGIRKPIRIVWIFSALHEFVCKHTFRQLFVRSELTFPEYITINNYVCHCVLIVSTDQSFSCPMWISYVVDIHHRKVLVSHNVSTTQWSPSVQKRPKKSHYLYLLGKPVAESVDLRSCMGFVTERTLGDDTQMWKLQSLCLLLVILVLF